MTPLPKAPAKKRTELSLGTVVAVASLCSAIVSGAVAWTVVRFTVAEAKPATVAAKEKPLPQSEVQMRAYTVTPPPENDVIERSQIPISPVSMPITKVLSTADSAINTVSALQEQYDTNPYFNNRGTLKGYLNSIQTNARQLQDLVAREASSEDVTTKARSLDAALERTIKRLDELAAKDTERDQNEAGISLTLKAKLEEIRTSLPLP